MRSLAEPADVDSTLLRNQIDLCFLKAMAVARDQMENGMDVRNFDDDSLHSNPNNMKARAGVLPPKNFVHPSNGSRPPRPGNVRGIRSGKNINGPRNPAGMKPSRNHRLNNRMYGGYHDQSMMMQPMQQGFYPPQFNPGYHHGGYMHGHYMPPQSLNNSMNTMYGWNNPYGGNDYSNLNMSMTSEYDHYGGTQFEPSIDYEASFHLKCDESIANTSIGSHNNFEFPHYIHHGAAHNFSQPHESNVNASFDEASFNGAEVTNMQTPSKNPRPANIGTPSSPSWAHLHTVPGLNTPLAHHGPQMFDFAHVNQNMAGNGVRSHPNFMNAKPLLINHNYNHFPQVRF